TVPETQRTLPRDTSTTARRRPGDRQVARWYHSRMPRCPYCFFAGAHFLPDGQLRCASCGKVYQQQLTYPQPPRNVAASPVPGGAGRAIIFVGAMVALVVSGAIVFALMADSEADQPWPEEPIYVAEPETRRAEPTQ